MHYLKRMQRRWGPAMLVLATTLFMCGEVWAQATTSGSETLVNTTTANDQKHPEVAVAPDGSYIVVWQSYGEDGHDYGIYFQRYNAGGSANGGPTLVNNTTNYGQRDPDVAIAANGNFVITWSSHLEDGDGHGVWFALYDNTATLIQRSRVNDSSLDEQIHPCVAMRYDGAFVVGYMDDGQDGNSWGISYQPFSSTGVAQIGEQVVNTTTTGHQGHPDVAMDSAGNYVFVWQDEATDGSGAGIYMRRFDNSWSAYANEEAVTSTTAGNQIHPSVEMDNDGNYMVAWSSDAQDGDHYGIFASIFDVTTGTAATSEIAVNSTSASVQDNPSVCVSADNTFVVAWTSFDQDGDAAGVYLQDFLSDGSTYGSEQQVNTTTTNYQQLPSVSGAEDTDEMVVVWQSGIHNGNGQDGSGYGIYMQRFSVADGIDPTSVCQNITVYLDGTGNATITAADVDGGSTDNVGITSQTINTSAFTCADIGANNVTLTNQDAAGNSSNCVAVVTVADTVSPTAVCQNIIVYLDGTGNASINAADLDNGSTDNCGSVSLSASQTAFTCVDVGSVNVTLTADDGNGNTGTCVSTVTVLDTVSPTAVCQNITAYLDGTGNLTITAADLDGGSSDNCSSPTLSASQTAFTCADIGANNVTLTVTDAGSNTATCVSTVTIIDSVTPTASCQNITVYLDGTGNATITAADIDNGSSDNCGAVSLSASQTAFTCANIGANNVTLTVDDGNGQTATCVAVVTVQDTVSPTAVCNNITVYLDGAGNATITTGDIDGGSTDNCGSVSLSASQTAFTCADAGANNVTLTADDGNGNTSNCVAVVTVIDSVSPTAVCQDITVYLDGTGNATITAADIDNGSSDNCGSVTNTIDISSFTCANIGANTVTLTSTDGSSNTSTCTSTVTVLDSVSPNMVCNDITVYLDGTGNATITAADVDGGSTDNCTTLSLGIDVSSFDCTNIGANTVTLTGTDGSSNTSGCTSTVTVADTTSPTASCQNVTVYLDGTGNATITTGDIDNGSTDNCSSITLSASQTAFTCADVGANNVTLTVTDGSSNTATCVAVVTVIDSVSPTASCQDITVYLDGTGNATITAGDVDAGSSDNCGSVTNTIDISSFTCANIGANTVTLTATDGSSNTSTCTSTVTVLDSVSPTMVCNDITVYLDGSGNASITAGDVDGGSTDNCTILSLGIDISSFTCANVGANTVTLTGTDGSSNTASCTATVTVVDSTSPTASCQNVTVYLDGTGNATITTGDIDNGSADNCSSVTLSASQTAFTCADAGANNVTLTVTDGSSNTSSCVAVVTVVDSTSPTAACQDITVYLDGTGNATITSGDIDAGSSDNCGTVTNTIDISSFTCANIGANTVTLTATDGSSNTSTCTSTVTVIDSTSPNMVCSDITVYLDGTGNATITSGDVDGGSTDNCTTLSLGLDITSFTCADIGANTVTLTGTDGSSNTASCTATVTVVDSTAPVVFCQDITVYLDGSGNATITTGDIDNGNSDNCSTPTLALDVTSFTCAEVGANTVTLTATDASSNSASCTATVTVVDTVSPTAVCQNITAYLDGTGNVTIAAADVDGGSTDGCGTPTLSLDVSSFTCANIGANTVTLTATDGSSNTSSCTATVTIMDTITPVLTGCPADINTTANAAGCQATVTWTDPTVTDNCSYTVVQSHTSGSVFPLGTTTVSYTYTDDGGNTVSCSFDINVTNDLSVSIAGTDVLCNGDSTGTGVTTVTGGTAPYTYVWSTGETGQDENSLSTGTHSVTVTDANGCTANANVTINEPTILAVTSATTDVLCFGDSTGTATLTITGGTAPYTENWFGLSASGLPVGTHNWTVTDANGCTESGTVTINEPSALTATTDSTLAGCSLNDGSAWVTAAGGTPGYTYLWDANAGNQTTDTAFNLAAGAYNVTVTDANGCTIDVVATVTNPNGPSVTATATSLLCFGDSNAVATATVTGGTPPFTYLWDNGDTGVSADSLPAGTWSVTVTDAASCGGGAIVVITQPTAISVTDSIVNVSCNGLTDGEAIITPAGGTPPYTFDWFGMNPNALPAGTHNYTITDGNGCVYADSVVITEPTILAVSSATTDVLCNGDSTGTAILTITGGTPGYMTDWGGIDPSMLWAGTFTYTVTDTNGCTVVDSVTITEPTAIVATIDSMDADCGQNNGQAWVTVSGGTGPYTYLWDDPLAQTTDTAFNLAVGPYTCIITDANGCTVTLSTIVGNPNSPTVTVSATALLCHGDSNAVATATVTGGTAPYTYVWDNGDTGVSADSLPAGTWTVTVTDAASCGGTASVVITEPTPIVVTDSTVNVSCNSLSDGEAYLTISGGTPPYTTDWFGATETALPAGTHPYTVTDANGCVYSDSVTITEPAVITVVALTTDVLCNGDSTGTASLAISGGTPGYTTDWGGIDPNMLWPGTFTYTVTDTNGCTYTDSVTITEPAALAATTDTIQADCGQNNGSAWVTVSGGTGPFSYLWDDTGAQTTDTAFNLVAGIYNVTVTDTNGCSIMATAQVTNPNAPLVNVIGTDVSCFGDTNGVADAQVVAGPPPFQFTWNTGDTVPIIDSLAPGTYTVIVVDSAGCTAIESVTIGEPAELMVTDSTVTDVLCFGDSTGTAALTITGGTLPYTEDWLGMNPNALPAGLHDYDVIDANGCVYLGSVTINEPTELQLSATTTDELLGNDGTIDLTVTGGTPGYTFDWDNDGTGDNDDTEDLTGLAGNMYYMVTVTDANGCTDTLSVYVDSKVGIVETDGRPISVEAYPNPNNGNFAINLIGAWNLEDARIEITDAIGKLVYVQKTVTTMTTEIELEREHIERGMYFINVYNGDVRYTVQLILQ